MRSGSTRPKTHDENTTFPTGMPAKTTGSRYRRADLLKKKENEDGVILEKWAVFLTERETC